MKTAWKLCLALALMVAALFVVSVPAFAAGTHTVSGSYNEKVPESLNKNEITFKLFKVGHFNGAELELDYSLPTGISVDLTISKEKYTKDGVFDEEGWTKDWLSQAKTVAVNLPSDVQQVGGGDVKTNEDGSFVFPEQVPDGLYLLVSNDKPRTAEQDGVIYAWSPQPMLVMVLNADVHLTIKPQQDPYKNFIVKKVWNDDEHKDARPKSIQVEIYYDYQIGKDNTPVETITLPDEDGNWFYKWDTLDDKYKDKDAGVFWVNEILPDDADKHYSFRIDEQTTQEATKEYTITNTYVDYSLKLVKKMPQYLFGSEKITTAFAYEIIGEDKAGEQVFHKLIGMSIDSDKEKDTYELSSLPGGIEKLTVTELYAGGAYRPTGEATKTVEPTMSEDGKTGIYEVEFENKYSIPIYNGGIVNRFTLSNDGNFTVTDRLGKFIDLNDAD